MADNTETNSSTAAAAAATSTTEKRSADKPTGESQKQRWVKYGANVAIASVVVILLAAALVYLAQKTGRRIDTTESRAYSLKPQTAAILKEAKGKTKLVSLYRQEVRSETGGMKKSPYAPVVSDLLDEYRRNGRNVEVEVIDPVQQNAKVEALISEVASKYGGEVQKYRQVIDAYPKTFDQIRQVASAEAEKVAKLPLDKLGEDDDSQYALLAIEEVRKVPPRLKDTEERVQRVLTDKPPDYKGAVEEIGDRMTGVSGNGKQVLDIFARSKANAKLPEPVRQYMASATPVWEQIRKLADELAGQTKNLGELKLDDLRTSLKAKDTILVVGENDMRVIPFEQVWRPDDRELRALAPGQEPKPRFAGEQQISTAILALNQQKKQKVVFVRNGGPPLAEPGTFPFGRRGGPFSQIAERLRQYNFEVLEKDLSGMWAMQAQMQQQQMPPAPEPSDEQIKDAIWVVLNIPAGQQNPMMPSPTMAPKVGEHLNRGGSALVLFDMQADAMTDALKPFGIEAHPGALAAHEIVTVSAGRQGEGLEEAQRYPIVFDIRNYGDHPITRPLQSLQSLLVPLVSITLAKDAPAGVKVTPVLPFPENFKAWGETDFEALQTGEAVKFDAGRDVAGPIYGGAVAEKPGGARVVVLGSVRFAIDRVLNDVDPELYRSRGLVVSQYPANAELFANSLFWLAKQEPMLAISPAAMEVPRIQPISQGSLKAWRVGGLLIGLPGIVILAGVMVWFARRD